MHVDDRRWNLLCAETSRKEKQKDRCWNSHCPYLQARHRKVDQAIPNTAVVSTSTHQPKTRTAVVGRSPLPVLDCGNQSPMYSGNQTHPVDVITAVMTHDPNQIDCHGSNLSRYARNSATAAMVAASARSSRDGVSSWRLPSVMGFDILFWRSNAAVQARREGPPAATGWVCHRLRSGQPGGHSSRPYHRPETLPRRLVTP